MSEPASRMNVDVDALAKLARAVSPGQTLTHEAMSQCVGRPIQPRLYIWLSARERLAKEGILFDSVRKEGYRRLKTEELPGVGQHARKRIRRLSSRAARNMSEAARRTNDMPHDLQKSVNAEISSLKLHEHLASAAAQKHVEEDATPEQVMPLAKTMESLRRHLVG